MKRSLKKASAILLSAALVAGAASAEVISGGLCGEFSIVAHAVDNSFDPATGTLTLSSSVVNSFTDDEYGGYYSGIVLPDGVSPEEVIHIVAVEGAVLPESCEFLFSYCTNMVSADLSEADASGVKYMNDIFEGCEKLESVDISGLDTSNVTTIMSMFTMCTSLTSVEWNGICTDNVTDMSGLFYECQSLESIDLSPLNTAKVDNMQAMFNSCPKLKNVDVSTFDISSMQANSCSVMFAYCINLEHIYASENWNTFATNSNEMFEQCSKLSGYADGNTDGSYAKIGDGGYFTERHSLAEKTYKQTAVKDGKYYTRFVFVKPMAEIAGKSKAKFTATHGGTDYPFETGYYYTSMTSNGVNYTPATDDRVLFVVTITSSSDISADITCTLEFK